MADYVISVALLSSTDLIADEVGPCDFRDAETGARCNRPGRHLSLGDELGRRMRRTICAQHSDWIEVTDAR